MLKLIPGQMRGSSLGLAVLRASLAVLPDHGILHLLFLQQWKQLWRSSQQEQCTNPDTMYRWP